MNENTDFGDVLETACGQCKSRFRVTEKQLRQAQGKVCCSECGCVFNAVTDLKRFEGQPPSDYSENNSIDDADDDITVPLDELGSDFDAGPGLSLHEAMYGGERRSLFSLSPLLWFIGILLLCAVAIAQVIYYQRYQLIENPKYQHQVINLCQILPCAESEFSSVEQIHLLERNVFSHPVQANALMVTGSFVNQAPFAQKSPEMLISLFDVQGKLIANRLFMPSEYLLENKNRAVISPGRPIQFRLEIIDPGTNALTYEFEFF